MSGCLKPIGGEHWFDTNIFDNELDNFKDSNFTFLRGGQSALSFIVHDLQIKNDEYILVPAYLCPTILWNFDRNRVNYAFYNINLDLSINLDDLSKKVDNYKVKAVFFINYFGFYHNDNTVNFLKMLKNRGIVIIEDAVQMLWFTEENFIGNYVFNSYRKFLPIDGSIVISKTHGKYDSIKDEYYEYMNNARMKITAFVKYGIGKMEEFVELFSKANEVYNDSTIIYGITDISKYLLSKVNYKYIGNIRKQNYCYLYDKLSKNNRIKVLFGKEHIGDTIPIGFPILIKHRDNVKRALRSKSIYCAAHWPIFNEVWVKDYPVSIYLTNALLTLPIDQRYDMEDMDRLINELSYILDNDRNL